MPTVLIIGCHSQLKFSNLLLKVEIYRIIRTKWALHNQFPSNVEGRKESFLKEAQISSGGASMLHSDLPKREELVLSLLSKVGGNTNESI